MSITIATEVEVAPDLILAIEQAIQATLQHEAVEPSALLTLLLTDDTHVQQLNRDFRGIDKTTDVLSFPDGEQLSPDDPVYLGDIAISVPQAERQAEQGGHGVSAELQLLAVHGTLHLLGYDHATPQQQTEMWATQAAILNSIGAILLYPTLVADS